MFNRVLNARTWRSVCHLTPSRSACVREAIAANVLRHGDADEALRRGAVVAVAATGGYSGKPRPAVVVQADRWLPVHPSVIL